MSDRMQQRRLSLPMELVWEVVVCIPADHVIRIKRSGPAQSAALNFMIAKFHRRYFVPSTNGPVMDFVRKLKRFGEVLPAIRPIRQYQQIVGVDGLFTAIPIPSEESLECLYGLAISYERYFQSLREPVTSIQYTEHLHRTLLMTDDAKRELGAIIATQSIQANQAVHQYFVQLKGEANALGNQFSRAPTPSMDSSNTSPNTSNSDAQENHQPMDSTGSTMNTAAGGAPPPPNQMQQ